MSREQTELAFRLRLEIREILISDGCVCHGTGTHAGVG